MIVTLIRQSKKHGTFKIKFDHEGAGPVLGRTWSLKKTSGDSIGYAYKTYRGSANCFLHRLIAGATKGEIVDHRNGNTLDNCRLNLRICAQAENTINRKSKGGASRFKGVWLEKRRGKWVAEIRLNGKRKHIGTFVDEIEAAKAYDAAARKTHGEFATLNFPEKGERLATTKPAKVSVAIKEAK